VIYVKEGNCPPA